MIAENQIRFEDGATYERMMGNWSRLAGGIFLDWLAPRSGLRWIDIGWQRALHRAIGCARRPSEVQGIDPSEGQLAFARTRPASRVAEFCQGDAMALPFPAGRFDAAVMALVIVCRKGVSEAPGWCLRSSAISTRASSRSSAGRPLRFPPNQ